MSLGSAMFTGVSGLQAFGNAMNVTGDNIANVNTVGFRSSRTVFADILATSVANGSANMQFGRGSFINSVSASFLQGSFETTGSATDAAIQGGGFFVLRNPATSTGSFYSRAGNFILDENGLMVDPSGYVAQGYKLTNVGGTITKAGAASDIDVTGVQAAPNVTTAFRVGLNLDGAALNGETFSTSLNVFNALGEPITLNATFAKVVPSTLAAPSVQQWDYTLTSSDGTVSAGATGSVGFDDAGIITVPAANVPITISGFTSGAADMTFDWQFIDPVTTTTYNEITGYAADSVTNTVIQDGFSTGVLRGLSIDDEGIISGHFSNGQTQQMYQFQLADFLSPWGLERAGSSHFNETTQSGQPILGTAKTGGFGSVFGGTLEMSNVDLGTEFVNMIQHQRAYQANSRIVTTVDSMLQEVVNLVR